MKKLIIHFGLHKTGSSSIQDFLANNWRWLKEQGIYYPRFSGLDGKEQSNHSVPVKFMFSDHANLILSKKQSNWNVALPQQFYGIQFDEIKKESCTLLLSAESISKMDTASLENLKRYFGNYDVQLVAYVRPAYSYYCSAVQELVKSGVPMLDRKKFIGRSEDIERMLSVFSNVTFFSFKDACTHEKGIVGHFCHYLQIPSPPGVENQRKNVGMGNVSVRLANEINRRFPFRVKGELNPESLNFHAQTLSVPGQPFRLMEDEFALFEDNINAENERLSQLTGMQFEESSIQLLQPEKLSLKHQVLLLGKIRRLSSQARAIALAYVAEHNYIDVAILKWHSFFGVFGDIFWMIDYYKDIFERMVSKVHRRFQ